MDGNSEQQHTAGGAVVPQDVLAFWFEEAKGKWFTKDEELDAAMRERFQGAYEDAAAGRFASWRRAPEGRLAEILLLDQFARNMFRGTPKAFAADELALRLARETVAAGDDKKLSATKRHFIYMPYMHSESKAAHREAMRLFLSLPPWKWMALWYEYKHKKIIDRFGRYPHRNAILGRESTPEELEFLKMNGGF